ncbi:hypothetical protein DFS33DRAFT_1353988 [Desarmillaria ectypa]|nr:hypothetical protein DFS33DRAFT_1353988 [Desarmillaria ectypa]
MLAFWCRPFSSFTMMSFSNLSVAIPSLPSTLGVIYLGSSVALVLYGIMSLQTFIYYKRYPDD